MDSSKSSVRIVQPLPELPKRFARNSRGRLGVDLHRDRDLAVPKDLHGHTRMYVQRRQQRAARLPRAVPTDLGYFSLNNAAVETAIEVAGFNWGAMAASENQAGFDPCAVCALTIG